MSDTDITLTLVGRYSLSERLIDLVGTPSAYKELAMMFQNNTKEVTKVGLKVIDSKTAKPSDLFLTNIAIKIDEAKLDLDIVCEGDTVVCVGSKENQYKLGKRFLNLSEDEVRSGKLKTHAHIQYIPGAFASYLASSALEIIAVLVPEELNPEEFL